MEDKHISSLDIGDGVSFFGVFDGHGGNHISTVHKILSIKFIGSEVACYVEKHLVKELKRLESFKRKDYRVALQEVFLKLDQLLLSKEG